MSDSKIPDHKELEAFLNEDFFLPEGADFIAQAPAPSYKLILEMSERALSLVNSRPDFVERKIARIFNDPFSL